jgi:hypothetical protein
VTKLTDEGDRAALAGALVREAALRVWAPHALRARLEARQRAAARRARWTGAAVAATLAAAAAGLVVTLPAGPPAGPSVARAAGLGVLAPQSGAPAPDRPGLLVARRDGVPFPDWRRAFGWDAAGRRVDRLYGRGATTVFYAKGARSLAYTIVGGPALAEPAGRGVQRDGTALRVLALHGRDVVTWRRRGRTCILVARGVPRQVLIELAAWKGAGALPF